MRVRGGCSCHLAGAPAGLSRTRRCGAVRRNQRPRHGPVAHTTNSPHYHIFHCRVKGDPQESTAAGVVTKEEVTAVSRHFMHQGTPVSDRHRCAAQILHGCAYSCGQPAGLCLLLLPASSSGAMRLWPAVCLLRARAVAACQQGRRAMRLWPAMCVMRASPAEPST